MPRIIKTILAIVLIVLLIAGFIYGPKYLRAMEIAEKTKMEHIEDTFINMDQYFDKTEVSKSSSPYTYPKTPNIVLPEKFTVKGQTYNTIQWITWTRLIPRGF